MTLSLALPSSLLKFSFVIFRSLQSQLDEVRQKLQQLDTKNEQLRKEIKQQENFNAEKIASLSRYDRKFLFAK